MLTCGPDQRLSAWRVQLRAAWYAPRPAAAEEVLVPCGSAYVAVSHVSALCVLHEQLPLCVVVAGCGMQAVKLGGIDVDPRR